MSSELVVDLGRGTPERWDDAVKGALTFRTLFSKGSTPTAGLTAGVAELAPGDRLAAHRHRESEVYLVLEGEGRVRIEDEHVHVEPGTTLFMPSGWVHEVVNTSRSQTLRIFYVLDADAMDDVEYEFTEE